MALPSVLHDQRHLFCLNWNELPILKGALGPGVDIQPLFIDPENGVMALRAIFGPGVTLPNHFHTGTVHAFTLRGKWYYTQFADQPQTAGTYLYEPGGSIHQFRTPEDNTEPTEALFMMVGANVNFDEKNEYHSLLDAGWVMAVADELAKAQGHGKAKYIRRPGAECTA